MVVMIHKDVVFEDQVVPMTGHAYEGCTFRRCTLVYRGGPGSFVNCMFDTNVFHIDLVVHDIDMWRNFLATTADVVLKCLPSLGGAQPREAATKSE